jgi:hypothetical protein
MASLVYNVGSYQLQHRDVDYLADTIEIILVKSTYTPANDRTVYDAADPSAWTLGAGDTIGGAIIGKKGSASDATAIPLFFLDLTDTPTNGAAITVQFDANGIAYTQQ